MELSIIEEGDIPIPINTTSTTSDVDGGHGHTMIPPHNPCSNGQEDHHHHGGLVHQGGGTYKHHHHHHHHEKVVRYRECQKNHAAAMGGNVTDGCGEFMPSGEVGTIEAFDCSVCHCHRNFHRKEVEGDLPPHDLFNFRRKKFLLGPPHPYNNNYNNNIPEALRYPTPSTSVPHHMIMPYNIGGPLVEASECDEEEEGGMDRAARLVKKRHRTKFSEEQKEKMLRFAEKVGWKIQKQEESVVQQFCEEIGVKRRVLKVWMHNNKAKKNNPPLHSNSTQLY